MLMKYVRGYGGSFLQRQMVREDFSGHLSEHRDGIGNDRAVDNPTLGDGHGRAAHVAEHRALDDERPGKFE